MHLLILGWIVPSGNYATYGLWADVLRLGLRQRFQGRIPHTPFLVCLLYIFAIHISSPAKVSGVTRRSVNCCQSCRGPPDLVDPPFCCFKIHSRVVLGRFPPATWQPLIRPCGNLSLGHTAPYQVNTPCQHTTSTCHVSHMDCTNFHVA
jgi:hypothetical protein